MSTPTILIVPGACQTPEFYQDLAQSLKHGGFATETVSLPSVGVSPGLPNFEKDVEAIRTTITTLTDKDHDIVLLMHSYGGIPASAASQGLGKAERIEAGKKGGIIRLLYVASFALRPGETMPGSGDYDTLETYAEIDEKKTTMQLSKEAAMYTMFHELSAEQGERWISKLKPQSIGALWSEQPYAAFQDIPSTYVVSELDRVIPVAVQTTMIENAKAAQPKAFDVVVKIECGHEPILNKVNDLVAIVKNAASAPQWK